MYTVHQDAATKGSTRGRYRIRLLCAATGTFSSCSIMSSMLGTSLSSTQMWHGLCWALGCGPRIRPTSWGGNHSLFLAVEAFGQVLCGPAVQGWEPCSLLRARQQAAVGPWHPPRAQHQSLQATARLKQGVSGVLVKASGVCLRHEERRPTAEIIEGD
jgi:hypothetical protein